MNILYEDNGAFKVATVLAEGDTSLQVEAPHGKRAKIKLTDRISAMKLIGQQHGMFKRETTVNGGTPIPVVLSPAEQLL